MHQRVIARPYGVGVVLLAVLVLAACKREHRVVFEVEADRDHCHGQALITVSPPGGPAVQNRYANDGERWTSEPVVAKDGTSLAFTYTTGDAQCRRTKCIIKSDGVELRAVDGVAQASGVRQAVCEAKLGD